MRTTLVFSFFMAMTASVFAQTPAQAPLAQATVTITATRIDGDPIPRQGYRFSSAHVAIRKLDPVNPASAEVLRVEVEITIDCNDNNGRPAQCPKSSVYTIPEGDFQIVRPEEVSRNNRGIVKYIGGGNDVTLGVITGLGTTEWVVLRGGHSITADHNAVRLLVRVPNTAPARRAPPATIGSDDLNNRGP